MQSLNIVTGGRLKYYSNYGKCYLQIYINRSTPTNINIYLHKLTHRYTHTLTLVLGNKYIDRNKFHHHTCIIEHLHIYINYLLHTLFINRSNSNFLHLIGFSSSSFGLCPLSFVLCLW